MTLWIFRFVEGRQSSPYQQMIIFRNYFTKNNAPYDNNIILKQVVSNMTFNYLHGNLGMHLLEISGFEKVRSQFYQSTSHNGFYKWAHLFFDIFLYVSLSSCVKAIYVIEYYKIIQMQSEEMNIYNFVETTQSIVKAVALLLLVHPVSNMLIMCFLIPTTITKCKRRTNLSKIKRI